MWVNHHRVFNLIRRTNQGVLALNLLLLLGVSFLPFPVEPNPSLRLTNFTRSTVVLAGNAFVVEFPFEVCSSTDTSATR